MSTGVRYLGAVMMSAALTAEPAHAENLVTPLSPAIFLKEQDAAPASTPSPSPDHDPRNPDFAYALTWLGPLGFLMLGSLVVRPPGTPPWVAQTVIATIPMGFGLGQVYAGNPLKGLGGGLGASALTTAAFSYLGTRSTVQESINQSVFVFPLLMAGLVGWGWWASSDVDSDIGRQNDALKASKSEFD